jgi:hypothetical protein
MRHLGLPIILIKFRVHVVLSQEDFWVGKTISHARMAYETWTELMGGKIKVEPERSPNHIGGGYVSIFTNYAKEAFLNAVAALHRGFFKYKDDALVRREVACRMLEFISEAQIDEFMKLGEPLRDLRNEDQHRENPNNFPVWSTRVSPAPPTIGSFSADPVDPSALYALLKSLEPSIGYIAFHRAVTKRANTSERG